MALLLLQKSFMLCPSCQTSQPLSFRCSQCGAEMMKGSYGAPLPSPAAVPPIPVPATGGALDNPYAAPRAASVAPSSVGEQGEILAGRSARLAAVMIDYVSALLVSLPMLASALLASAAADAEIVSGGILASLFGLLVLGVLQASLLVREGQTIGKRLMKIRIVDHVDGQVPHWARLLGLRYAVNTALRQVPFYGLVDVLLIFGQDQRCLHDYIAGTKVIEA